MKKYEIVLSEDSLRKLVDELGEVTDFTEVIPDYQTRIYVEKVHAFMLDSIKGKLVDVVGDFAKKKMISKSSTNVTKLKLNMLEINALYYELEESKEVILQLQSIILDKKVKLLGSNGR